MSTASPGNDSDRIRESWNRLAPGYDEFVTPMNMWVGSEGLRRAGLGPGMRFLDVAAGSGALSIPAARLGARVLSTDLSPVMLARLEARAKSEGLEIETRVMDGHALDLEDDQFDVSGSQFGVMLFPDMPRGIRELVRVTRPGGRVLMNVFGSPRKVEFITFYLRAIQEAVPGFPGLPDPPPLPFQLQDPERLRRELTEAGLRDVRIESLVGRLEFQSGAQMWDWLLNSNPVAQALLSNLNLNVQQTEAVKESLDRQVRERAGADGVAVLTNLVHVGVGTK